MKKSPGWFTSAILCYAVSITGQILSTLVLQSVLDDFDRSNSTSVNVSSNSTGGLPLDLVSDPLVAIGLYGGILLGAELFKRVATYSFSRGSQSVKQDYLYDALEKFYKLNIGYVEDQEDPDEIASNLVLSAIQPLSNLLKDYTDYVVSILSMLGVVAYSTYVYSWPVAVGFIALIGSYAAVTKLAHCIAPGEYTPLSSQNAGLLYQVADMMQNYRTTKFATAESHELEQFEFRTADLLEGQARKDTSKFSREMLQTFVSKAFFTLILIFAGREVVNPDSAFDIGDFTFILTYIVQVLAPLEALSTTKSNIESAIKELNKYYGRLEQIVDNKNQEKPSHNTQEPDFRKGCKIEFQNAIYTYPKSECKLFLMSDLKGRDPEKKNRLYVQKTADGIQCKILGKDKKVHQSVLAFDDLKASGAQGSLLAALDNTDIETFEAIKKSLFPVAFQHGLISPPVFRGLSFVIHRGERVGIMGLSGAGKSTLLSLLLGVRPLSRAGDANSGAILVNDFDISSDRFDLKHFRKKTGYVSSNVSVFRAKSFEYNICYGFNNLLFAQDHKPQKDEEGRYCFSKDIGLDYDEALNAADLAHLAESNTSIQSFSTGEKQRVNLARLILKKPELLIFDEATSALDMQTEGKVLDNMLQIMDQHPNATVIVVAHRLASFKGLDRIIILHEGKVVENVILRKGDEDGKRREGKGSTNKYSVRHGVTDKEVTTLSQIDENVYPFPKKRNDSFFTECFLRNINSPELRVQEHVGKNKKPHSNDDLESSDDGSLFVQLV